MCPDWAADSLQAAFGDRFEDELSALLAPASFDLRVNAFKADRQGIAESLRKDGIDVSPTPAVAG